jgi:hypothetical protein
MRRGEMQVHVGMLGDEVMHQIGVMGLQVVDDAVQVEAGRVSVPRTP